MVSDMVTANVATAPRKMPAPQPVAAPVLAAVTTAAPATAPAPRGPVDTFERAPSGALYTKQAAAPSGGATAAPKVPAHVDALVQGATGAAKADLRGAAASIASGDYKAASAQIAKVFNNDDNIEMKGYDQLEGVKGQVEFLAKMQAAGVKADYPPTEAQLTTYFGTLKGKTGEAVAAFESYVSAFHVNPKQANTGESQVTYTAGKSVTKDGMKVPVQNPTTWQEVTTDRKQITEGRYAGMSVNDCEGYALMGDRLLGAAGFKRDSFVVGDGPEMGHQMLRMRAPSGELALVSNDRVFLGKNANTLQNEGLAYSYEDRKLPAPNPKFYSGQTMQDAQVAYTLGKR